MALQIDNYRINKHNYQMRVDTGNTQLLTDITNRVQDIIELELNIDICNIQIMTAQIDISTLELKLNLCNQYMTRLYIHAAELNSYIDELNSDVHMCNRMLLIVKNCKP
jgi:hypothetical protein